MLTAWDGHMRIDVEPDVVRLTTLTIEATTEVTLRPGLVASFVSTDPYGPPTALTIGLRNRQLPDDVAALLGTRLTTALTSALGTPTGQHPGWVRLNLAELDELAAAWAPYRARVLAGVTEPDAPLPVGWRAALGTWSGGLWTSLGGPELAAALDWASTRLGRDIGERGLAYRRGTADRGDPAPDEQDEPDEDEPFEQGPPTSGRWRIPDELAAAAGVEADLTWLVSRADQGVTLHVRARPTGSSPAARLFLGWDDESDPGVPLTADPLGRLSVELTRSTGEAAISDVAISAVRLRAGTAADDVRE